MQESFKKAQLLFNDNEFETAFEMFRDIGLSKEFDHTVRINSLSYAIKCKENIQDYYSLGVYQFELVRLLFKEQRMSEALELLPVDTKSLNEIQKLQLKEILWQIYIQVGLLEKAEWAASQCLESLFFKGDVETLRKESSSMKDYGLSKTITLKADYMLCFMSGAEEDLIELFERDLKNHYSKLKDRSIYSLRNTVFKLPRNIRKGWSKKHAHKAINAWFSLQEEHLTPSVLKNVAINIFEYLVENQNTFIDSILLINYAFKSKRFDFADQVSKHYQPQKNLPELNRLVRKIEEEMVDYSEIPEELGEDIDYATDLFRSENVISYDSDEKVKKLEKEIKLLKEEGHHKKVAQLVDELEEYNPSHDYVKEQYEKKLFDDATKRLRKHKNIDEVREDLLKEIKFFTNDEAAIDEERIESALRKTIEYMDDHLFRSSQTDLAIACLELGFPKLAERLLDDPRAADATNSSEESWYLKVHCMIESGRPDKALDYLNEQVLSRPLAESDYVCFLYMKGEVLRASGKRLDALRVFKRVSEINPRYRLVRLRLKESV